MPAASSPSVCGRRPSRSSLACTLSRLRSAICATSRYARSAPSRPRMRSSPRTRASPRCCSPITASRRRLSPTTSTTPRWCARTFWRAWPRGAALALVSDAGTPLVSDPGFKLVSEALAQGTQVTSVPGASAVLAALVVAGLPTDRFFFEGFLPQKQGARRTRIAELAAIPGTLVFFESPRRLADMLADLAAVLGTRQTAIARELTKHFETVRRGALPELARALANEEPPKGEIVVLVAPPAENEAAGLERCGNRRQTAGRAAHVERQGCGKRRRRRKWAKAPQGLCACDRACGGRQGQRHRMSRDKRLRAGLFGRRAEQLAILFLRAKGYRILARTRRPRRRDRYHRTARQRGRFRRSESASQHRGRADRGHAGKAATHVNCRTPLAHLKPMGDALHAARRSHRRRAVARAAPSLGAIELRLD